MNKDEFKRKYCDTHTELALSDKLKEGSLVKNSPGDKNITVKGKIPGKNLIEHKEIEKRNDNMNHMVLDAIDVKAPEILDVPIERLLNLAIKMKPQKVEGEHNHTHTFVELVKKANEYKEKRNKYDTVDVKADDAD